MIEFEKYAEIKNNYCVCYLGPSDQYILILDIFKDRIQRAFPEINISICCRDEFAGNKHIPVSQIKKFKKEFAHINELRSNSDKHFILEFIEESGIKNISLEPTVVQHATQKAVIISSSTSGIMEEDEIQKAKNYAVSKGFEIELNGNCENSGLVIGIENSGFVKAGMSGTPLVLSKSSKNQELYSRLFPSITLW